MIENEMTPILLHSALINKNFVPGDENCNYEKYLLELVNESLFFKEKSKYKMYTAPKSESKGECDCISDDYTFDFKLIASTTRLQASKELSNEIQRMNEGITLIGKPRRAGEEMVATRLFAGIRGVNCDELLSFLNNKYEFGTVEFDIQTYVKLLCKKKNLFLFFPYQFIFKTKYNFRFVIDSIKSALNNDFKESDLLRKKCCPGYDTYLAFVYDDNLIVMEFQNDNSLKIIDVIYLFKSKTYTYLYNRYVML